MEKENALVKQETALVLAEHLPMTLELLKQFKDATENEITGFIKGIDFVEIPGVPKPFMAQPGAEKLGRRVRLRPDYGTPEIVSYPEHPGHREVRVKCKLYSIITGEQWGEGIGVCSTLESKYRYRQANRKCPECGKEAIIKGKKEYGGGWLCWKKNGGCGAKYQEDDPVILEQQTGRVENPDIADVYHTIEMMAQKRAFIKAIRTVTATSDKFTQDEDLVGAPENAKNANAKVKDESTDPDEKATQTQLQAIANLYPEAVKLDTEKKFEQQFATALIEEFKASSTADLSTIDADECITRLQNYITEKKTSHKRKVAGTGSLINDNSQEPEK
jgi:ssDNA-binding Zn-finger/Zn-ribbon topoisomerase 1